MNDYAGVIPEYEKHKATIGFDQGNYNVPQYPHNFVVSMGQAAAEYITSLALEGTPTHEIKRATSKISNWPTRDWVLMSAPR